MKKYMAIATVALLFVGCTPKMGKDIMIEPEGSFRLENTGGDVVLGVLSLLGVPVENAPIRIGSDLKVINRWHSDIKIVSLNYGLHDEKERIAEGKAKVDKEHPVIIAEGGEQIIPISLEIDTARLNAKQMEGIFQSKRKIVVKGEIVLEVWGWRKHYPFEKEATKLIEKALKGSGR